MQKPKQNRDVLVKKFGETFSLDEMSGYLGVDKKWLWDHYSELGGIRLGRKLLFFEKRIERVINDANFYKEKGQMAGLREKEWAKETEDVSNKGTGFGLGGKREKSPTKKELRRDKHGLLDTSH
jgi:hypothetical protein